MLNNQPSIRVITRTDKNAEWYDKLLVEAVSDDIVLKRDDKFIICDSVGLLSIFEVMNGRRTSMQDAVEWRNVFENYIRNFPITVLILQNGSNKEQEI